MKKFVALLTAFVLLSGILQVPAIAFAEEKTAVTLKQSIEIAKSSLGLNTEGYEFTNSYSENQNGYNIWNLNWNNTKTNKETISVSVDAASGKIISIYWWVSDEQSKSKIPKYSRAEALKAAQKVAAKLQGDNFKQTRLADDTNYDNYNRYAETYNFEFIRVYDDVDVPVNNISVQIDKNTLKTRYFNIQWDKGELTAKSKAFSLEKAKELLKSKLGLELTYNVIYNNQNNEPSAVLAYTMKNGNSPIDAFTGELLNTSIIRTYSNEKNMADKAYNESVKITPEEQYELEKNSKYISKSEAEQAIKQYITIDNKMKLESANLYPGNNKENTTWNLAWRYSSTEDNTYRYINAQIDAVTKEIKSFNISDNNNTQNKDKATIKKEQAKKLAEDFLKVIQPDKFSKTQYKEYKEPFDYAPINNDYYYFNFTRIENGIPCPSNSLNVGINAVTGEIVSFNTNWLNINFPAPNKVITLDKAYEVLLDKVKFGMQYVHYYKNANYSEVKELKLAYVLENMPGFIDANSSQMLDYNGNPIKQVQKLQYTDIKGNKAEDEIKLLIEIGIIEPDNTKFMPDTATLQKDFIKLLINSLQPEYYFTPVDKADNQYDSYYAEAIKRKIINEADKKPDTYVTRQDAAKMIIRAMGYGVIAEKSNMFVVTFKDASKITNVYKGYVVMAAELGIIAPIKSYFNPANNITRGDAAEIIVNYLKCETSL